METINTVRINPAWLDEQIKQHGGMNRFAEAIGVTTSTISRQYNMRAEASPRFIGAVLANIAVQFQDAFDVTEEKVRVRRARMVKSIAA